MDTRNIDRLNPFPWYSMMRMDNPVYYNKDNGLFNVFKYTDVKRVLGNFNEFSSQFGKAFNPAGGPISESIINLDPPRHTKLRNIVSRAFTPRAIDQMESYIREIAEKLLTDMKGKDVDIIKSFTSPLPVTVIAKMLGIPIKDMDKFKQWSDVIVGGSASDYNRFPEMMKEMIGYFQALMIEKEKNPDESLIYSVISAEVDGEKLSMIESLGFFILLLVAGNETTTNLIGNALLTLDENLESRKELVNDPTLIPGAIEEVLRYRSPVKAIYRVARDDITIHDVVIKKGSIVVPWIASANRVQENFQNPDTFDISRKMNKHIAFGEGIHYCLGAPLARLEAKISIEMLLQSYPDYRVLRDKPLKVSESEIVYGLKEMWVSTR